MGAYFAKILLKVMGPEETMTCQDDQMCSRLKARIDGVIPRVQAIWGKTSSMEEWVFLLVDAKNAFNKINQVGMLWTFRHL